MKNPAECAGEEFGRNLSVLRAERVSGLGQASDLEVALGTLLQHEVQRIEQKYGAADPRRLRVAAREAANLELINRFEVERQAYQVDVPEVAEDGALIHGRVVDEQELALSGLVACLVDDKGKPIEESQDSPMDASGYFAIRLTGQDVERILERQPGVLLGIVTTRGSLVYQDLKSRKLAKGAQIFAEIALVRNEVLEGGTVIRPPRPKPGPRTVKVPDVTGETEDAAVNLLKESGLSVGTRETEPAPDRVGIVLAQNPAAGTEVKPQTPVDLVVGAAEAVAVPGLVGIPLEEAEQKIKASRLKLGEVETRPSEQVDIVLEQDPAEGTEVAPGTPVDLVVGAAETVEVPGLVGAPIEEAERKIKASRLKVGEVETRLSEQVDIVLEQAPVEGAEVAPGTPVDLVVGAARMIGVPTVVGTPIRQARREIETVKLKVGEIETRPSSQVDMVLEQDPAAGTEVAPGTAVKLVVGAAAEDVEVPKVVGVKMKTASRRIKKSNLTVGQIRKKSGTEADRILAQDPAAGTKVPAATPVDLVVSTLRSVSRPGRKKRK